MIVIATCTSKSCEYRGREHEYDLDYLENKEPLCGNCGDPLSVEQREGGLDWEPSMGEKRQMQVWHEKEGLVLIDSKALDAVKKGGKKPLEPVDITKEVEGK